MVQLFQQLESQQLANLILKSKIESLKALNGTSRSSSDINFESNTLFTAYSPRSMPTTPTAISANDSIRGKNSNSKLHAYTKDKRNYLSKDDLALNTSSAMSSNQYYKKHEFKLSTLSRTNSSCLAKIYLNKKDEYLDDDDDDNDDDDDEEIIKNTPVETKNEKTSLPTLKNSFDDTSKKAKHLKAKLETKMLKKYLNESKNSNQDTCSKDESKTTNVSQISGTPSTKTPKSALLEKRRKAVFELLTHEIYPSGKHGFFFYIQIFAHNHEMLLVKIK